MTARRSPLSRGAKGDRPAPRFADIAVFRLDNIGDSVLTSGLLGALRRHYPTSLITVFCQEASAPYFRRCPYVNRVVHVLAIPPTERGNAKIHAYLAEFEAFFSGTFDLVINPRAAPDHYSAAQYVGLTKAETRVGFRQTDWIGGFDPNPFYTILVDRPGVAEHAAAAPRHLLAALGIAAKLPAPGVWSSARAERQVSALLPPGRWIALGIGASEPHRIWPAENFAAVARALAGQGYRSVLVGGPADRPAAEKIMRPPPEGVLDLTGRTNLDELGALLGRCCLYIGNDSGPKHIAAAQGVPVVEVGWLLDGTPGFEPFHHVATIGVPNRCVLPPGPYSAEATRAGAVIRAVPPSAVLEAAATLLPTR